MQDSQALEAYQLMWRDFDKTIDVNAHSLILGNYDKSEKA